MEDKKKETKLAWIRHMRGLSQGQLAAKAGVATNVIKHAEQRYRKIDGMSARVLWKIATALEVPMESLLEHEDD